MQAQQRGITEFSTREAMVEAFRQYRAAPTRRQRDALVMANMGLVKKAARRWEQSTGLEFDELVAEGVFGLIRAVDQYDPATGNAFSSYAMPWIHGAIQHWIRDHGWGVLRVPRKHVEDYAKVTATHRRLAGLGRSLPLARVAELCGFSAERWRQIREARERANPCSLEDGEGMDIATTPTAESSPTLLDLLGTLPPMAQSLVREWAILGRSPKEIATRRGMRPCDVEALLSDAVVTLKNAYNP